MDGSGWIEHRRAGDGERLGWIVEDGAGFVAIDLLGRMLTGTVDWMDAESALELAGIGYLADPFEYRTVAGEWIPVRLTEVSQSGIRLKEEDYGDVSARVRSFEVPFPLPDSVRPRR